MGKKPLRDWISNRPFPGHTGNKSSVYDYMGTFSKNVCLRRQEFIINSDAVRDYLGDRRPAHDAAARRIHHPSDDPPRDSRARIKGDPGSDPANTVPRPWRAILVATTRIALWSIISYVSPCWTCFSGGELTGSV